ncbi:MAG: HD family phosphohydrolase [Eubacterium sp.]
MKERVINLLRSTKRTGMENLIEHMEKNGFFTSPCSGGNHTAKKGGLLEHSLNVFNAMDELAAKWCKDTYRDLKDSIIICAILHDLGKIGDYGKPNYIPNMVKDGKPTKAEPEQKYKQSEKKPYEINKELLYEPHEVRSVKIAAKYIELTEEEEFAILMHNGLYGDFKYAIQGKETPLYMLLHFADMWASRVMEVKESADET